LSQAAGPSPPTLSSGAARWRPARAGGLENGDKDAETEAVWRWRLASANFVRREEACVAKC